MKITAELAADLYVLTAALDESGMDVSQTLHRIVIDATAAISTYLGLNVVVRKADSPFSFTVLNDGASMDDVGSSISLVMPGPDQPAVTFTLYAAAPGTFVDLAADLAWLTERPASDFSLDTHPSRTNDPGATLEAASTVDQAIGVLISRGHTPAEARRELDGRAFAAGTDRWAVACLILDTVSAPSTTPGGNG